MAASEDILSLQEYWITRVKNVAMKFEKEGLELLDEYNALKVSIDKHCVKCPNTEFSGPCFPVFGLNTGNYGPDKG